MAIGSTPALTRVKFSETYRDFEDHLVLVLAEVDVLRLELLAFLDLLVAFVPLHLGLGLRPDPEPHGDQGSGLVGDDLGLLGEGRGEPVDGLGPLGLGRSRVGHILVAPCGKNGDLLFITGSTFSLYKEGLSCNMLFQKIGSF